jgi:hypothetical protein
VSGASAGLERLLSRNDVLFSAASSLRTRPRWLIAQEICAEITPDLAEGYAGMLTPKPA